MYKFFKQSKTSTPVQSPQSPPQQANHMPEQKGMPVGSSPGTALKHPADPVQGEFTNEEVLMDQINSLKKMIQDKECEHVRRVETLIEALSEKAEENIQILNELESTKEQLNALKSEEAKAATEANTETLPSPMILSPSDPSPLLKSTEPTPASAQPKETSTGPVQEGPKSTTKSEEDDSANIIAALQKELEEEKKKTKSLEKSVNEYKEKVTSLENRLQETHKWRIRKKHRAPISDTSDEDIVPDLNSEIVDPESGDWILVSDANKTEDK